MAEAAGNEQGKLARRATWGAKAPRKRWPSALLNSWVPTPGCLCMQGGSANAQLIRHTGGRARGAWVPTPSCLAWRTKGKACINISGVLGPLPQLFEHLMATGRGRRQSVPWPPGGHGRPTGAGRPRNGSSAVPAQGHGCQRATCPKSGRQGPGTGGHGARQGSAASGQPVGRASMVRGEPGAEKALQGQKAPYLCPHWPLGSMGSRGRRAIAKFGCRFSSRVSNESASKTGLRPSRPVAGAKKPECHERQSPVPLVAMQQPHRGRPPVRSPEGLSSGWSRSAP